MDREGVRGHVKASMHPDTQVQIISNIDAVLAACVFANSSKTFYCQRTSPGLSGYQPYNLISDKYSDI